MVSNLYRRSSLSDNHDKLDEPFYFSSTQGNSDCLFLILLRTGPFHFLFFLLEIDTPSLVELYVDPHGSVRLHAIPDIIDEETHKPMEFAIVCYSFSFFIF